MTGTPAIPPPAAEPNPYPEPATAPGPRKRYNGLALAALIVVLLAWIGTLAFAGFWLAEFARTASEGNHFGVGLIALLFSAGLALLITVPLGILGFILALISVFLRNFRKAMAWIALVLSLPFLGLGVTFGLLMAGMLGT